MGKKKVTMELISSRSVRATTFKKRKTSLLKKASELAKLCSIQVGLAVAYWPDDPAPQVWPSPEALTQMVLRTNSRSDGKHTNKMTRQVADMQIQLQRLEKENLDLQAKVLLEEALSGSSSAADLEAVSPELGMRFSAMLEGRMKEVQDRIDLISSVQAPFSMTPDMVHPPLIGPQTGEYVAPAIEQFMSSASPDPFGGASLLDGCMVEAMPALSDLPEDSEEFFNGLPADIAYSTQWCGSDWDWDWEGFADLSSALWEPAKEDGDEETETMLFSS